jgi:MYXO-CTERM domain-containing protein
MAATRRRAVGGAAIGWIALLSAAGIASARPAQAGFSTAISSIDVDQALQVGVQCGAGVTVGAGFDSLDEGDLTARRLHPYPFPTWESWEVTVHNGGAAPRELVLAAICADDLPAPVVAESGFTIPLGTLTEEIVFCPFGMVAAQGGADTTGSASASSIAALSPYFPFAPGGARLRDQADGAGAAPLAWHAAVRSQGSATILGTASVSCIDGPRVATSVVSSTFPGVDLVASAFALCPVGWSAVGGGVDAEDLTALQLLSSSPLFPANDPFPRRLAVQPVGPGAAPIGWRVALRRDTVVDRPFRVAAVCVPEPGAPGLAAAALLGLGSRRRRRSA